MGSPMTRLIKSGSADRYRPLGSPMVAVAVEQPAEPLPVEDAHEAEIRRLEAEIARLHSVIESSTSDRPRALETAREEGKAAGMRAAASMERERTEALRASLQSARDDWNVRIRSLDRLAAELVRAALEKLFCASNPWSAMIEQAVARQLDQLGASAVIGVKLSPADFEELPSVDAGAATVGLDDGLPSGAARLELKLGQVDIDLPRQTRALLALLERLASGDVA